MTNIYKYYYNFKGIYIIVIFIGVIAKKYGDNNFKGDI